MRITFIIALPGSGKTYLANELNRTEDNYIIDDPSNFKKDVLPYLDGRDLIIVDPLLCIPKIRHKAWDLVMKGLYYNKIDIYNIKIQYIYFENDISQCKKNIENRKQDGDLRNVGITLELLAELYEIPNDVKPIKIWKEDENKRI
jgi:hypothetical protein